MLQMMLMLICLILVNMLINEVRRLICGIFRIFSIFSIITCVFWYVFFFDPAVFGLLMKNCQIHIRLTDSMYFWGMCKY